MHEEDFLTLLAVVGPQAPSSARKLEERLRDRSSSRHDWQAVARHAERHRVVPLFANRLQAYGWMEDSAMPVAPELQKKLGLAARDAVFAELASFAELRRINTRFGEYGIAPVLLKGLALSQLCFGRVGWRTNHDIDLLIKPGELETADRLLAEMDYVCVEPGPTLGHAQIEQWKRWHKDWTYVHKSRRTIVEIHYRLFDNERLSGAVDLNQVEEIDLFGQHRIYSLTGDALRSYLALHGLLHNWSRLKWIIDYRLIRGAAPTGDGASVAERVADALCATLFAEPRVETNRTGFGRTALLLRSSLSAMTAGGTKELEQTRFGTTIKNISHYLISLRPAYWIAELRYDLTDVSRDGTAPSGAGRRIVAWACRKLRFESKGET